MKYFFFLSFIVAVLFCGPIKYGPFSFRVYFTILMILYLLFTRTSRSVLGKRIDKIYIVLYFVFILFLLLSLTINDGFIEFGFIKRFLAYYLVGIVSFFAVERFVQNYEGIERIAFVIAGVLVINSVVSLLQFANHPIGWAVGAFFSEEDIFETFSGFLNTHKTGFGTSILIGILGHPVTNGFYIAVATPLLITGLNKEKNNIVMRIYYLLVIVLSIITCFVIQQRAAFYLLVLVVFHHFYRVLVSTNKALFLLLFAFIFVLLLANISTISNLDLGRLSNTDNSDRVAFYNSAFEVILHNPLFGNPIEYAKIAELSTHNVFLDSFVTSGFGGFIIMCVLYFKTLLTSVKLFIRRSNIISLCTSACAYSVFIAMLMGLVHNTSYYTGDALIFVMLALMLKSKVLDKSINQ